ncbi:MAG: sialate O-acetylesterase [Microbacter sp.]
MKLTKRIMTGVFLLSLMTPVLALVRLPKLVSNGMVLQRDVHVKVWGWADPSELVTVKFLGKTYSSTTDQHGNWSVMLPQLKAGGPFSMTIQGSNTIQLSNILIGDVWLCSGQSNMELPVRRVSWKYPNEIASSKNKFIRQFMVPQTYDFQAPQSDLKSGSWVSANPTSVLDFSAVAYFFGRALYDLYKVPVGLINSSLGGSPLEAWLSEDALNQFPLYLHEAQKFKDNALIKKIDHEDATRIRNWYETLRREDAGYQQQPYWYEPSLNTSDWKTMKIPGYWDRETSLGLMNGVVWFRKEVQIPASMAGKPALLILGRIVDADSVFVNGQCVGTTSYQYPPRRYQISASLLKKGTNVIVVRVMSNAGEGGFVPDKEYALVSGPDSINLKGDWQYRPGATMSPLASQTFIRWKPEGLYNAMIAPLLNYRIKGVIWYQGESNTDRPLEYAKLLPALIQDWRQKWDEGNFPFLIVQLPNFMPAKSEPSESNWALLRESQLKTLSVPNTALVVTIDLGEWNDIHPLDKKDVGQRLLLAAERVAYGNHRVVYSGPIYQSMKIEGNKIILSFDHVGSGLTSKGSRSLHAFAIAGTDRKFIWAHAVIRNNKVIVWNDEVKHPVAVRYAWADNPAGANLYNREGLPASPFRTDDWAERY